MQKISSYLYPNMISVVADIAAFPVRWNVVYQNRIKIYQGVDNVLTIDVKNSEQKRIDISEMQLELCVMDMYGSLLVTVPLVNTNTKGLATATITEGVLVPLQPQYLNFTIYRVNLDQSKTLLYADSQFGAKGQMELVGSATPIATPVRYITRWLEHTNDQVNPWVTTWYSDAVEIAKPNFLATADTDSVEFVLETRSLAADVTVEFTKDPVISAGIKWETVDTFSVDEPTSAVSRIYSSENGKYNREWAWARVNYVRKDNNKGFIDKIAVKL